MDCHTANLYIFKVGRHKQQKLKSFYNTRDHEWLAMHPNKAPSTQGQAQEFFSAQSKEIPAFHFNRPPSAAPTIPIALYHPIFGQFKTDSTEDAPSAEDHEFVLTLSQAMSGFYDREDQRLETFRNILINYGFPYSGNRRIGAFTTNGDMRIEDYVYNVTEGKVEMASGKSEPLLQSGWYYTSCVRDLLKRHPGSTFPCLIIYLAGKCYKKKQCS